VQRPSPGDLAAARARTLEDVIAPGLRVLFVGINPGLWSGATGFHFARPGNRFWKAIYLAGLTPHLITPERQLDLLEYGLGITNLASRTTAVASELSRAELQSGAGALVAKVERFRPKKVAFLGLSSYRVTFSRPAATVGRQADLKVGGSETWVMPNPSGLNAHYQLSQLAQAYSLLKR
jgi:TDG/mug DNA glycosylase family protein